MRRNAPAAETTIPIPRTELPGPMADADLDEFERYAVADAGMVPPGEAATCGVGAPGKLNFFRCPADASFYRSYSFLVCESEGRKRTYLLSGNLLGLPELEGHVKIARTTPFITHHGALGLWLISIEHDDNPWVRSGLLIAERAKTQWVAAVPIKKQSQYRLQPAGRDYGEPAWPDLTLPGWLKLAFPPEYRADIRDHPIMKLIRGE
jgi:hypothetical protein